MFHIKSYAEYFRDKINIIMKKYDVFNNLSLSMEKYHMSCDWGDSEIKKSNLIFQAITENRIFP